VLSLQRNPIASVPHYRAIISSLIPLIERLDGIPVDPTASQKVTHTMVLEAASIASTLQRDRSTHSSHYEKESTYSSICDASAGNLPDTGSELTHGSHIVLAGNAASAIRRRHDSRADSEHSTVSNPLDLFDSMLLGETLSSSSSAFFKEGDITDLVSVGDNHTVSGSPDRRAQRRPSSTGTWVNPSSNASSVITKTSQKNDLDNNSITSASSRRPLSAAVIQSQLPSSSTIVVEEAVDVIRSRLSSRNGFRAGPVDASSSTAAKLSSSKTPSIVHMDIVKRRHAPTHDDVEVMAIDEEDYSSGGSGHSSNSSASRNATNGMVINLKREDTSDDDSDEEESMISHAARHRLMSSQGRRPAANTSSSSNPTTFSSSTHLNNSFAMNQPIAISTPDFYEIPSSRPSSARGGARPNSRGSGRGELTKESNSMIAGKSLGFDLYGSLAAIEQWADNTTDSSDDDAVHAVDEAVKAISSTSSTSSSSKALAKSIATAADVVVASNFPVYSHASGRGAPSKRSSRATGPVVLSPINRDQQLRAKDASATSSMILHRDKILNMVS
jgi:hypothetical protein